MRAIASLIQYLNHKNITPTINIAKFKSKIILLASTNHFVASCIGFLYSISGMVKRKRGSLEHLKSTISLAVKSTHILGRPINITIEPTNVCNLLCPVCETGANLLGREKGHMSLDMFKTIIDKIASHTNTLMFYFMGEPFMNKNAYEMIRYAKDQGIPFIETCTNGDPVNPKKLIECGIDKVSFQIGGMTQETHQIYRINSNLERVINNMRETIKLKHERKSKIIINTGFILMKHNEHEVESFKAKMIEYGVDEAQVIDPCVRNMEQAKSMLPTDEKHWIYDPEGIRNGVLKPRHYPDNCCPWMYYSLVVHVNGNVVPCCRDPLGEEIVGNLFTETLDTIWNGPKYRAFREKINTDQGKVNICKLCSSYPASAIH